MIQSTAIRAAAAAVPWRVVAVVALAGAAFGAGWTVNGWRKDAELAELTAARAQADLATVNQALGDLKVVGADIRARADEYRGITTQLDAAASAIRKELKNAKPLPADCRPDDFRVRKLSDAVDAAKRAAAAR
ncbi:hypothetical protein NDR89_15745 [Cupriavidus gilardii]|uniref:DUF2570 domain-containing protein n=1 Tax=Cupriavidus gilardii TaxID=82541 RepID=A0ABY4VZ43_9BURK|nr:hypothetical protein [Cupriavidus gilardii]USE81171.1 hypothetical protein NDR89_15745 [Cupriavidus gilardii]